MKKLWSRLGVLLPCLLMAAPAAFASDPGTIDTGDTAWVLISAALVFIMTPGLGFFYGGMVRNKNVLTTIMQSFFIVAMISVEWILIGYAMTFGTDINGFIGSLDKVGLTGVGMAVLENGTIPEMAFVAFQCMFAVITPALITGAFAERMKFHAFVVFILLWAIFIYNPMAHWVWGGGFLAKLGALDFAGGLVIHILSGVSGLTLCVLLGKRYGYGKIPMVPHNLPMTVLGAALLCSAGSVSTPAVLSAPTHWLPARSSLLKPLPLQLRSPGSLSNGLSRVNRPSSVPLRAASPAWLPSHRQLASSLPFQP